jgi:hypothetical protein
MDFYQVYSILALAGLLLIIDTAFSLYFKFKRLNCEFVCRSEIEEETEEVVEGTQE